MLLRISELALCRSRESQFALKKLVFCGAPPQALFEFSDPGLSPGRHVLRMRLHSRNPYRPTLAGPKGISYGN
jgi:hypothetical protein